MLKISISCFFILIFSTISYADKVDFSTKIWPIIKEKCIKCHRAPYKNDKGKTKKPKAGLRLDTAEHIMKGSEDGKVIVAGKPKESSFYTLTLLDKDDDDVMPSDAAKKGVLTKEQKELIKNWITEGANFGSFKTGK
jgi:uncharacterized membrane protein